MAFNMGIFSRGNRNAGQDMAANSEFGEAGDSQFMQNAAEAGKGAAAAGASDAPAAAGQDDHPDPNAGTDSAAPLRLRDALGRRGAPVAAAEAGAGFKLPLIGH